MHLGWQGERKTKALHAISREVHKSGIANQCAAVRAKRHSTATENATILLPSDPELAAVVDVVYRLPGAIRVGILAMVKASDRPDYARTERRLKRTMC